MKKMLFIDARNVFQAYRLKRDVGTPTDVVSRPVITDAACSSVLQKPGESFKIWYDKSLLKEKPKNGPTIDGYYSEAYAESADGITWEEPDLSMMKKAGKLEQAGYFANNTFLYNGQVDASGFELCGEAGPEGFHVLDSEKTPHPCARSRYTAMYLASLGEGLTNGYPGKDTCGICFAHSEDGINWLAYKENPVIQGWMDNSNCFYYDPRLKKYVLYGRPNLFAYTKEDEANRFIGRTESEDLIHWSPYQTIFAPDDRDADPFWHVNETEMRNRWCRLYNRPELVNMTSEVIRGRNRQYYGISTFPYGDIYLGLLQVYDIISGSGWLELVHSYNSLEWQRESVPTKFIGPKPDRWDKGMTLSSSCSPPVKVGSDFWIYYNGNEANHHQGDLLENPQRGIGIKKINKDQLVGYRAAEIAGELITAPFHKPERITLIANLPRGVSAELNGPDGERVTGFEHADGGSALENGVIVFAKSLSEFPYDTVRLRMKYTDGIVWGIRLM